jgi:2,3-bisphosphoglycerate-dependent phosphoglycerate mutase
MTTLLIARHGNTFRPGDIVMRAGARTDLPLVQSGLEQAAALGRYLHAHNLRPDHVFTSHLQRTKQTAYRAMEAIDCPVPMEPLDIFNEVDYGPDENKPETEVVARLGEAAIKAWDEDGILPEGWKGDVNQIKKAWLDFGQRMAHMFKDKTVLVVTSNGVARFAPVLTGDFEGFKASRKLKISTGAFCRFEFDGTAWTCTDWNVKP